MSLQYTISTHATGRAIVSDLIQPVEEGETFIISTASGVLNPNAQRYSIAEQEELAIVFVLQKIKVYVFGCEVNRYSENKTTSFIHRCALTSRRICRFLLQLQEYDLRVKHIRGSRNFLGDAISRKPAGTSEKEINRLTRPRGLVASAVDREVESSVGSKLRDLHIFHAKDPKGLEIIRAI
jgi:hypothetical protein